jgi:hypothetical protein
MLVAPQKPIAHLSSTFGTRCGPLLSFSPQWRATQPSLAGLNQPSIVHAVVTGKSPGLARFIAWPLE